MERNGHFQPDDNAVSFRTNHFQTPGTAKDQHHQQPAVSCRQSPCKSPPPHHQQQASPAMLQVLATAYKLMQIQQEQFRLMASISGTTAAWDAIYNDRFAEEDARLNAECERLLGLQHDTTGLYASPETANHLNEQSTNDLLQAERGRRPYPVDQDRTAAQDRRESVEGGIKPPQLNIQADAAVETEIPDQPVSKQTPVYPTSNALNRSDDVINGGGSQLESSKKVAQSISIYPGITVARSNNHVTGGQQFATSFNFTANKCGCLSCFINTQLRQAKTTRSHRLRLRPKTRWKSTSSTTPGPSLHFCVIVVLSSSSVLFKRLRSTRSAKKCSNINTTWRAPFLPDGPATTRFSHISQHKQHLQVSDYLMGAHQRYIHHFDLH